jgi:hypothetical protein
MSILLIMLLTGGGVGTPLTDYLKQTTVYAKQLIDEKQRKAVLATVEEMEETQKALIEAATKTSKQLAGLADSRSPQSGQVRPVLASYVREETVLRDKLLQQRFRLKSQLTREQWAAAHAPKVPED